MRNLDTLIFFLFIAASALSWLVKKLQAQASAKRASDRRERERLEALRTGRVESASGGATASAEATPAAPAPVTRAEAAQRLQELARKRAEQLEALRRKAQQTSQSKAAPVAVETAPATTVARPNLTPAGVPRAQVKRTSEPKPPTQRKPRPDRRPTNDPAAAQVAQAAKLVTKAMGQPKADAAIPTKTDPVARGPSPASKMLGVSIRPGGGGARQWRRLMLLREIMDPPVSMRSDSAGSV